jgi:L-ascorbate metabolism protein UlaG (beta-lactamase superfamily)
MRGTEKSPKRRVATDSTAEGLQLTHFGAAAWRISDGKTTVYVDPYFSRLRTVKVFGTSFPPPSNDPRHVYRYDEVPVSDTATIDKHVTEANFILISHSHFNHCMDMPYIAKKTGATVIGTESTANLARASGVPDRQIIPVRGGEDFEFGAISVKAIPSLHSSLVIPSPYSLWDNCRYFDGREVPRDLNRPPRLEDYVEGGTLAYMIRFGAHHILVLCSMNYIEREMVGLEPTIALIPASPWRLQVHDYTGRLIRALGKPPLVVSTHWDLQSAPYGASQDVQLEQAEVFVREVKKISPVTKVVIPRHFGTVHV